MDYRGRLWEKYIFIPSENSVVLMSNIYGDDHFGTGLRPEKILMITNITTNEIIYQPQISGKGFVSFNFPYLELEYDCSSMDKTDSLQILVEADFIDLQSLRTIAEARAQQTQVGILKTLLKIEKHLELMTDEQITEDDIAGPGSKRK